MIFFGHSYGGIIAYELANLLSLKKNFTISNLIISSTNNPQILTNKTISNSINLRKFHLLSNEELLNEITLHGGVPSGIHPDILQYMLPIVRSDYLGLESYQYQDQSQSQDELQDEDQSLSQGQSQDQEQSQFHSINEEKENIEEILPFKEEKVNKTIHYRGLMTIFGSNEISSEITADSLNGWKDYCYDSNKFTILFFPSTSHFYFMETNLNEIVLERIKQICEESMNK